MATTYWIVAGILCLVAVLASVIMTCAFIICKRDGSDDAEMREVARFTLVAYSATVLSWAWPLVIPLALLAGLLYIGRTAFTSINTEE